MLARPLDPAVQLRPAKRSLVSPMQEFGVIWDRLSHTQKCKMVVLSLCWRALHWGREPGGIRRRACFPLERERIAWVSSCTPKVLYLKCESQRQLAYASVYSHAIDDAERRRLKVGVWVRKLGVVQRVVKFSTELNTAVFNGPMQHPTF